MKTEESWERRSSSGHLDLRTQFKWGTILDGCLGWRNEARAMGRFIQVPKVEADEGRALVHLLGYTDLTLLPL